VTTVDPNRFRAVMGAVCAPVTIVTTTDAAGRPRGATVSSFTSLSLDPPLVGVAFDRRSALLADVLAAGRFGVNLLGHGQDDLAVRFATRGADRFTADTAWFADRGLPRLADATGWVGCELDRTVDAGDHLLLFGLVTALSSTEHPPLVHARRTFGTHSRFTERPRPPITDQIAACAR
jgi:flavin reductase (DIM6/NTAB) family NADH-FMN oxidoreductase RutF